VATGLSDFFKYNLWANLRLLDTCERLTDAQLDAVFPGTYGSIRVTLKHLLGAEENYAARSVGGFPPTSPLCEDEEAPRSFAELREHARRASSAMIAFAEQITPEQLQVIQLLDEGTYRAPLLVTIVQFVDHGIDHRTQICTALTQLGIQSPELDVWAYNEAALGYGEIKQ
jgi:uncharacterized damage-inducible protein DinB